MGSRKKRVAFIPVRGGSKSIPKKNIKRIAGKPLVYWVIDAALKSQCFDDIFISTDDQEITDVIQRHPQFSYLTIVERSPETATDTATTESAMLEFAQSYEFDIIALVQATSPLLTSEDLREAMDEYIDNSEVTSLLSVCRQERFIWKEDEEGYGIPVNYDPADRPRRQDFDGFLVENGAFYITDKESLLRTKNRLSGNIICYEMSPETYYELDEPTDWPILESLLEVRKTLDYTEALKDIKLFLTDVDGVLTDAGMYYSEKGDELKKFNTRDGKGLELLRKQGIKVGIITSEDTQIVADRAKKLQVNILHQGIKEKGDLLKQLIKERNLAKSEVAYIGDDINDLSIIREVGFSACPHNAMEKVKKEVDYICKKRGGEGCAREFADLILEICSGSQRSGPKNKNN